MNSSIDELTKKALEIRQLMVKTLLKTQIGHPGGSFSSVDILTALYFRIMNIDPKNPSWSRRDRFVLSKGHASLGLYSVLATRGFFEKSLMNQFRQNGSILSGHPDMRKIPGVDMSTGSLGQGLSVAIGMALATKYDGEKNKVFAIIGDGESQEGQIWEAAIAATQFKLDNLITILDRNMFQIDGCTEDIMKLEPLADKWKSFGWSVKEVDGHDMNQIVSTLESIPFEKDKPNIIIAKTIKGKGLRLMENKHEWHGMKNSIKDADAISVLQDVGLSIEDI